MQSRRENEARAREAREEAEAAARAFAAEHGFTDNDFSAADFTENTEGDNKAENSPKD